MCLVTRFFKVTSFVPISDLFRAENVTSIWWINRSLWRNWSWLCLFLPDTTVVKQKKNHSILASKLKLRYLGSASWRVNEQEYGRFPYKLWVNEQLVGAWALANGICPALTENNLGVQSHMDMGKLNLAIPHLRGSDFSTSTRSVKRKGKFGSNFLKVESSRQFITTSAEVTTNGGLVRESPPKWP